MEILPISTLVSSEYVRTLLLWRVMQFGLKPLACSCRVWSGFALLEKAHRFVIVLAAGVGTWPLIERKRRLRELLAGPGPVLYADHVARSGVELFEAACVRDLVLLQECDDDVAIAGTSIPNDSTPIVDRHIALRSSRY